VPKSPLDTFLNALGIPTPLKPFRPGCAHFNYGSFDVLLYLSEDCSYRAKYLPGLEMELLYHPYEDRIVGVKILNFSKLLKGDAKAAA
jgi:hypothetical protein